MSSNKKVQRREKKLKESRGLRAKALVAAQFEDCVQAFQQLSDSLQVNPSNAEFHTISDDCGLELRIWGYDSGASSRALDYALKGSPVIKKQTLSLLKDLHSVLDKAIDEVRQQEPDDPDTGSEIEASVKVEPPTPDAVATVHDELVADDQDGEGGTGLFLEEAGDVVRCLNLLLPALRDPPQQNQEIVVSQGAEEYFKSSYQHLARSIFPKAPETLIRRLSYSNWQRRQEIRGPPDQPDNPLGQTPPKQQLFKGGRTPWDQQIRQAEGPQKSYSEQPWDPQVEESEIGESTVVSHVDTVLTQIWMNDQDTNSSAPDASLNPLIPSIMQHLVFPPPPVTLPTTEQFACQYCRCDLPLAFSSGRMGASDWTTHVYEDLKPYMCTFDDCFYGNQLYGDRREWFQHELDFHRSPLIWSCSMCQQDFDTAPLLEAHLHSSHSGLSSNQLNIVREHCKRYSRKPLPAEKPCVICSNVYNNIDELEIHLGNHLEVFALASLVDDELPAEEELETEELLEDFLDGLPDGQEVKATRLSGAQHATHPGTVPNALMIGTDTSHMGDTSEITGLEELEDDTNKRPRNDNFGEKVATFLDTQDALKAVTLNVPSRYKNFVGRDGDLETIGKHLSSPGQICTISGRAGIGKTGTAVEYVYRYEAASSYVFWVEAETTGICAERYASIANTSLVEGSVSDEASRIFQVRDSLFRSKKRWLLVFDNATSWSDISRYIPRNLSKAKGSVLITTRSASSLTVHPRNPISHNQNAAVLDVWPMDQAREFLLTSITPGLKKEDVRDHEEYETAATVVKVVGCLPLAISIIVGYVKVSRCTLSDFLEMWAEKELTDKKRKTRIDIDEADIDTAIHSLWDIGIREVRMNSRHLLNILSFLDAETVQKSLLVGEHKEEYLQFLDSNEALSFKRMIHELEGRRLLGPKKTTSGEPAYSMHRVLQQKILNDMEDFAFADAFRKAFRLVRKRFPAANPQQVPQPQSWVTCQEYIPHVDRFCRIFNAHPTLFTLLEPKQEDLAELFSDAGFYVWSRQTTAYDGLAFLSTANSILDSINMDPNCMARANILCISGLLLTNSGCIERAEGIVRLKQAWKIRKHIYQENPSDDNDVLLQNSANDYSLGLLNQHEFAKAATLMSGCHASYLKWGPESKNPFENSKYYGNFSIVLMVRGEMDRALEFQEQCLRFTEQFSGSNWAQWYRRAFMHGCLLLQSGDTRGALDKHLEVLTARLNLHGRLHESTILSTYAVGAMYHHLGELDTASAYIKQCIECIKMTEGDRSSQNTSQKDRVRRGRAVAARARYHLALLYRELDVEEEAAAAMEKEAQVFLDEYGDYAADCVRGADDKMMILDDLQPTFSGRYTGLNLLKRLQEHPELCLGRA